MIDGDVAHSESLGQCSRDARLTFFYLLTVADSHGRMRDSSRVLLAGTYPDDDDVTAEMLAGWIEELVRAGVLHRYQSDDRSYLHFPEWERYQTLRNRGASKLPEPDCTKCNTTRGDGSYLVRPEVEREVEVEKEVEVELSPPATRSHSSELSLFGDSDPMALVADDVISPQRLVCLLAKEVGEPAAKLAWLDHNLPLMLCEVEALGSAITTRKQAMAKLRTLIFRWYRHQHEPRTNGSRASPQRQAPESFDEARIRKNAEWLESLS